MNLNNTRELKMLNEHYNVHIFICIYLCTIWNLNNKILPFWALYSMLHIMYDSYIHKPSTVIEFDSLCVQWIYRYFVLASYNDYLTKVTKWTNKLNWNWLKFLENILYFRCLNCAKFLRFHGWVKFVTFSC